MTARTTIRILGLLAVMTALTGGCAPSLGLTPPESAGPAPHAAAGRQPSTYTPTKPTLPAAARQRTGAGAAAFSRYFFAVVGFSWGMPRAGLVGGLSAPDCQACTNYAGEAERLIAAHERFASPPLAVESVRVLRRTGDGYEISAAVEQQATRVYNLDGSLARDQAREELTMLVETRWTATGWQVLSVRKS